MKSLIFTNFPNGNFRVEFVTDLLHDKGNFTVMEIKGLDDAEVLSSGIDFKELNYDVNSFKDFADSKNLKLELASQDATTTLVAYEPLVLVETPVLAGAVDIETDLPYSVDLGDQVEEGTGGPVLSLDLQEGYTLPAYASISGTTLTLDGGGVPGTGTHDFELVIKDDRGEEIEVTFVVTFSDTGA